MISMETLAEKYAEQLNALLPTGIAWPRENGLRIRELILAIAAEFARIDMRGKDLMREVLPSTTHELLSDWERVAGLPDTCVTLQATQTVQERRNALVGRLTGVGGQSAQYFIELARALGFEITITFFRQFRVGVSRIGDALYGDEWRYAWRVNSSSDSGRALLECVFNRLKPAHTILLFGFTPVLELSMSELSVPASGGNNSTFYITSNRPWAASSSEGWLIFSPASGSGNAIVAVSASENQSTTPRVSTITVSAGPLTQTLTVSQAGAAAVVCDARELVEYFGKNRVMIGAQAQPAFFSANPGIMDVRYIYIANAVAPGPGIPEICTPGLDGWWGCWNSPPGQYLRSFIQYCAANSLVPMVTYYTWVQTANAEEDLRPANDVTFLRRYFDDWRFMLQQIGNARAIIHIEPDLWGFAQHRSLDAGTESPVILPAAVQAANPTDSAGFQNNVAGLARCMIAMVRRYAPNARVGLHASSWATMVDVNYNTNALLDVEAHAQRVANYLLGLGASETDFVVIEACDRDADFYRLVDPRGWNRWWNTGSAPPNFAQHFRWAREIRRVLRKPLVWWQLPLGNARSPNIANTNDGNTNFAGFKDNRVDWFLTPHHLNEIAGMGGALVAFGSGQWQQTTPLSDSGNMARWAAEYKLSSAGGNFCEPPAPPAPALSISVPSINIGAGASAGGFDITCNTSWGSSSNASWCTVAPASGRGNATVEVSVQSNTSSASRSATITISAGGLTATVTITQAAAAATLSVNPTSFSFGIYGGQRNLSITSNTGWSASSDASWCGLSATSGSGNASVVVTASENQSTAQRTATITITGGGLTRTVAVTQAAAEELAWRFRTSTLPSSLNWSDIVRAGTRYVAIARGTNICAYSTDGLNWTLGQMPTSAQWCSIAHGAGRCIAIAGGPTSAGTIGAMLLDGSDTWQPITLPAFAFWSKVRFGGVRFLAIAEVYQASAHTTDGITWDQPTTALGFNTDWRNLVYAADRFFAGDFSTGRLTSLADGANAWAAPVIYQDLEENILLAFIFGQLVALRENQTSLARSVLPSLAFGLDTPPGGAPWLQGAEGDELALLLASNVAVSFDAWGSFEEHSLPVSGDWSCMASSGEQFVALAPNSNIALVFDENRGGGEGPGPSEFPPRIFPAILPVAGLSDTGFYYDNSGGVSADPGVWVPATPIGTWVVFRLSTPRDRLLFHWMASWAYSYNVVGNGGGPTGFDIEYSSVQNPAGDSDWQGVTSATGNILSGRATLIEGPDIRWVRFRVTSGGGNITEIDIHDLTAGLPYDTWAFVGDSITADTFMRRPALLQGTPPVAASTLPHFNTRVSQLNPARFPFALNCGIGNYNTALFLADDLFANILAANSGIHYWCIGLGSNVEAGSTYEANLRTMVAMIRAAGHQPIIARAPHSTAPAHPDSVIQANNIIVGNLTTELGLPAGPDLWTIFYNAEQSGQSLLRDGVHPNAAGIIAIQEAWAQVANDINSED